MRLQLVFVILVFAIGAAIGDRYGLPGFAQSIVAPAFEFVEGKISRDNTEDTSETDEVSDAQSSSPPSYEGGGNSNASLTINEAGLAIIKESEGLRLDAYQNGGQWLIGYGHSRTAKPGMTITESKATQLLLEDVAASENAVRSMARVRVNRNQFSAMVSLAYNLGSGGFSRSVVLSRLNDGDYAGAADGFLQHNRAGGQIDAHLTERRQKERALFLS